MTRRIQLVARTLAFASLVALAAQGSAQRGGGRGGGAGAGHARSSGGGAHRAATTNRSAAGTHRSAAANHSTTRHTNRNVNVNNNVNVNRNVNAYGHGHGYAHGQYGYGAPVARGVVAGATAAAVMGSYYQTLPSGCTTVDNGGLVYHHCGSTWYRTDGS